MQTEAIKTEAVAKPPVAAPLNQTRISEASFKRSEYFVSAPAGTKFEDITDPTYWRHVAHLLKPYDLIDFTTEDQTFYARLFVVNSSRLWSKVHVLIHADLQSSKENMPLTDEQNHVVEWKGPNSKYAVIRKTDRAILKDQFTTIADGWNWLEGHLKSLNT